MGEVSTEQAPPVAVAPARFPWVVAFALLLIGITAAASLGATEGWSIGKINYAIVIGALQVANYRAAGWLSERFKTPTWQLDAALVAASVILLDPFGVAVVLTVGVAVGCVLDRRSTGGVVVMTLDTLIMTSVVSASVRLVAGDADPTSGSFGVALAVAVLVGQVVWELCISWWFRATYGDPFVAGFRSALRFGLPRAPFIASLGYTAAIATTVVPIAGLFAVPALAAMVYVLAVHFRAERDRERAETLYQTAEAVHASVETEEVAEALQSALSRILGADGAELRSLPPDDGEIGVPIEGPNSQWLVASAPAAGLGPDAEQLLSAVAAIGSTALDNARLVQQLKHQAVHDTLTNLPNQVLFSDRVSQAAVTSARKRERFAVVAIDLDAFRKVNDSLGHAAGDQLLVTVAERMGQVVRVGDTVARLSGDTFMLLLPGVGTAETAGVLTEKLLASIARPIELDGQDVFMTACAGLAFFPDDGQLPEHLLRNADSALHRAKASGTGSYQIYAQGMNELAHQRLARESELHQAVRRDELRVRYQPQVDLRTGKIVSVEALVRWEHPTLGLLAPVEFVPLAEESGLIVDVDTWVLRRSARQAATWLREGLPPVRVGVNVSARHFQSPERLIGTIRDVLSDSGLPPMLLELEVTEGLAVTEDESALVLQRIRDMGVSISIDDFGTGYSMLGRLSRFPVDRLKIDRSFVKEIRSSRDEAPIVAAIIAMARSLKIETVAEGVETLEQQTYLRNRSCDLAQGFLFSTPVEADELERLLRSPSLGFNVSSVS
jgi:diguanylate cyclase (GGDEF)-like protein